MKCVDETIDYTLSVQLEVLDTNAKSILFLPETQPQAGTVICDSQDAYHPHVKSSTC